MPIVAGITTNLEQRRKLHAADKKTLRKWALANGGKSFATRELALAWLKAQPGEKDPNTASAPGAWFGFTFEY
ncbi:MAG: hypothetical protein HYS27_10920 [Deltaproteobacteria bacterium]|nr:hypothetical protein [Deltaproteobacteria bacterium]